MEWAGPRTQRKKTKLSRHSMTSNTHRRNDKSEYQECTCEMDKSLTREMCIKVESHASFVTTVIAVTLVLMLSILFNRVIVNILVFVLRVVFYVTWYMYDARRQDFAISGSFVSELECFDGSEVTGKAVTQLYRSKIVL